MMMGIILILMPVLVPVNSMLVAMVMFTVV